jgi:hypothetical protein
MRWVKFVAHMCEMTDAYQSLVTNLVQKPKLKLEVITKWL